MLTILFLDVVVVAALVYASRRRLEHALPVFTFFACVLPYEARIVIPGLFDLGTTRVAIVTLFMLYLVKPGRAQIRKIPQKALIALHICLVACSTVYSLSFATSAKQGLSQAVEYYVLYFVFVTTISEISTIKNVFYAMVLGLALCAVLALPEPYARWSVLSIFPSELWVTYNGRPDPLYIEWGRGLRVRSTFPHPILFGDALAMCIPIALYLLSVSKEHGRRFVLAISLLFMAWALYKTSSRGPWIACAMSCGIMMLTVNTKVRRYIAVMGVVGILGILSRPGVLDTIVAMYVSTTDSSNPIGSSYLYRGALTDSVIKAVNRDLGRSVLGYGLGTFRERGLDIDFQGTVQRWYTCDNNWALFLYETGYVGFFVIGLLLFRALLFNWKACRRLPRPQRQVSGVIFIVLAAFYFMLMSVAGYSWGQQGLMAWVLIGSSVAYERVVRHGQQAAAKQQRALGPSERLTVVRPYDDTDRSTASDVAHVVPGGLWDRFSKLKPTSLTNWKTHEYPITR